MSDDVFGMPVTGTKCETSEPVEQADPNLLREAFADVFDFTFVEAIRWEQYTPYFNDGDACEFGVSGYSFAIQFADGDEDGGEAGDGFYNFFDEIEDRYEFVNHKLNRRDVPILKGGVVDFVPTEQAAAFLKAGHELYAALDGGRHEIFLKRAFGDHASITATREGFSIDFYEHD